MSGEVSITSNYSRILARVLTLHERELPRLLANTGLPIEVLMPGDRTRLTWEQQLQVLENARRISTDPDLGLRIGTQLQPSAHGPIGYLALSSPDLITALKALRAYLPLRIGFAQMELEFRGEWLICHLSITSEGGARELRLLNECFAMLLQSLIETVLGKHLSDGQFGFRYSPPPYEALYRKYLHAQVCFNEQDNYLRIPAQLALAGNAHGDADAYALARDMCQGLLDQASATTLSMSDRVRRLLLSKPAGGVTEQSISRALFVSRSTLTRRLAAEGTSYRKIREALYAELAARHLRDGRLSVEAIAALLGYHDTPNFRRAFRRWYGMPPGQYRQSMDKDTSQPSH